MYNVGRGSLTIKRSLHWMHPFDLKSRYRSQDCSTMNYVREKACVCHALSARFQLGSSGPDMGPSQMNASNLFWKEIRSLPITLSFGEWSSTSWTARQPRLQPHEFQEWSCWCLKGHRCIEKRRVFTEKLEVLGRKYNFSKPRNPWTHLYFFFLSLVWDICRQTFS